MDGPLVSQNELVRTFLIITKIRGLMKDVSFFELHLNLFISKKCIRITN